MALNKFKKRRIKLFLYTTRIKKNIYRVKLRAKHFRVYKIDRSPYSLQVNGINK